MATTQKCCEQHWTSPEGNTQQSSSCTATCQPSRKLSKLEEPDMRDTISDVLRWTPLYGRAKAGCPARSYIYIQHLCTDTGCCLEDLPEAMEKDIRWGLGRFVLKVRHDDNGVSTILTTRSEFNSSYSLTKLINHFKCQCDANYAVKILQLLTAGIFQHVSGYIRRHALIVSFGPSQMHRSTIEGHFLNTNSSEWIV